MRELLFIAILLIICVPPLLASDPPIAAMNWPITVPTLQSPQQAQPPQQAEPAPTSKRVIDGKFVAVVASLQAATVLDYRTTFRAFDRGAVEVNPFMRWATRSETRANAVGLAINGGVTALMWKMKKSGNRLWWLPGVAGAALHVGAAIHNNRIR